MSNKKRETRTIDLTSGGKAEVYTYFDRNAEREIRRAASKGIVLGKDGDDLAPTLEEATDMQIRREDAMVLHGTRCVFDVDGTKQEMSNKVLDSLSRQDFNDILVVLDEVFLGKGKK